MLNISEEISTDNSFNILDILLIDHSYLKECINVFVNNQADLYEKLLYSRTFLDTLKKYHTSIEKTIYHSLYEMDEFKQNIIKGEAEHTMIKKKYQILRPKLVHLKKMDNIIEVEIKVLAKLVKQHIEEEEQELFPKMRNALDDAILNEIGFQFMILRKFTPQDLENYPELQKKIYSQELYENLNSKNHVYQWSASFIQKVNGYIGYIVNQSGIPKNQKGKAKQW